MQECRSPHGERGLKYFVLIATVNTMMSLPAWGAWVEMFVAKKEIYALRCRSPHGERGLK